MKNLKLVKSTTEHLLVFFQNQQDPEANQMAAFTSKDPNDKEAYISKWTKHLHNESIVMRTILLDDEVVGTVCTYPMDQETHITYWINKAFWGQGISTMAVGLFLQEIPTRPIHGSIAFDNVGSMQVLLRNGFKKTGSGQYFANARGGEIEEVFFVLEG